MTTPQAESQTVPQYVYGVTRADATIPDDLAGLEDQPVRIVSHDRLAALTSDLPTGRPLGQRADLMAHQRVLQALVEAGVPVLPFRFGAALAGEDAVRGELLESNADRLNEVIEGIDGRIAVRVKGTYDEDAVLREVLTDEPEIAELSARLRSVPEEAADAVHFDRVRLGEMIVQALHARRAQDGERLLAAIAPYAQAVVAHDPVRDEDVIDASLLVTEDKREEFEKAVESLSEEHGQRIRLRMVGPLPPYDFVPEG
ncbi:GvpL/GvpF family gas vesicle protein [Spirillospora sp. NPDC049652]